MFNYLLDGRGYRVRWIYEVNGVTDIYSETRLWPSPIPSPTRSFHQYMNSRTVGDSYIMQNVT